jgi:hypothetical protein
MRRKIPVLITAFVGVVLIFAFFIPHRPFGALGEDVTVFFDIVAVFAFILGGGNLIKIHGNKIYRRARDWPFSIVTVGGFFLMLGAGLFKIGQSDWCGAVDRPGALFDQLYRATFDPLQATMYALLAFFVASASFRAFRAKNREATVLLIAAFVILLGRTPAGDYVTAWLPRWLDWLQIPNLANWIMAVPNLAGQRAIIIGIALGVASLSLRVILGVERSHLGSDAE